MAKITTAKASADRESPFLNGIDPIWCSGCGDFTVLDALAQSLEGQELLPHNVALVSGIGCAGRLPGYMRLYGFNAIHGRALPIATGLKLARPELTVVVAGGDGDAFSIGAAHLMHAARRNVDITYLVMDNGIYGLTKGQASPTTPEGTYTKSTQDGSAELPLNPLELMLAFGAGYVSQYFTFDLRTVRDGITAAMAHRGFSFVNLISPCPTYRGGMGIYKELRRSVSDLADAGHDSADYAAAMELARDTSKLHSGIVFRREAGAGEKAVPPAGDQVSIESLAAAYL